MSLIFYQIYTACPPRIIQPESFPNGRASKSQVLGCLAPQPFPVLVEKHRGGHKRERQEAEKGVAPAVVERGVHLGADQGKKGAEQGADDDAGPKGRGGGLGAENVDEVELRRQLVSMVSNLGLDGQGWPRWGQGALTMTKRAPNPMKNVPMMGAIQCTR